MSSTALRRKYVYFCLLSFMQVDQMNEKKLVLISRVIVNGLIKGVKKLNVFALKSSNCIESTHIFIASELISLYFQL